VPSVKEAAELVAYIDHAILTGTGDIRSNAILAKLLSIARHWVAEHTHTKEIVQ
jgi:pyridoxal/pyridoxine/pyridoxamine kinase